MKNAKLERRKFLAAGAATLAAPGLAAPAVGQSAKTATLKFVPQANLTLLDPILTTALVTTNHAYYVFDTLYSAAQGFCRDEIAEVVLDMARGLER